MLDASASQERILHGARRLAAELAAAVLRPGRDEAAVVSFTGDATVAQDLTGDLDALRRAFASVEFTPPAGYIPGGVIVGAIPGGVIVVAPPSRDDPAMRAGTTALWDSLVQVCDKVFARAKP